MGHGPKTLPRKGIADVQPKECARKMLSLSPTNPGTCSNVLSGIVCDIYLPFSLAFLSSIVMHFLTFYMKVWLTLSLTVSLYMFFGLLSSVSSNFFLGTLFCIYYYMIILCLAFSLTYSVALFLTQWFAGIYMTFHRTFNVGCMVAKALDFSTTCYLDCFWHFSWHSYMLGVFYLVV